MPNEPSDTRILIIDDDDLVRLTLKSLVKKAGFCVSEADNGRTGMALFSKEKPDIVITDILMPDQEGLQTITEMRKISPHVAIIAMSGGGSTKNLSFLQLAKQLGANYTISKPIKPETLMAAIKSLHKN